MAPEMAWTFLGCTGAFGCVFAWLLRLRLRSLSLRGDIWRSPPAPDFFSISVKAECVPLLLSESPGIAMTFFLIYLLRASLYAGEGCGDTAS